MRFSYPQNFMLCHVLNLSHNTKLQKSKTLQLIISHVNSRKNFISQGNANVSTMVLYGTPNPVEALLVDILGLRSKEANELNEFFIF